MKVLFAVNSENISEAIIKKYQKDYREILSYKNVYYFDAILKEIQKDKSYDRIIISEDLEPFSNSNYDSIDKFVFEKLDRISDEAHDTQGNEISIILISSDRHTKGSSFLVKIFGIGVYNALLGNDRSMEEVCRLINKPRTKKEAKMYYKIDTDDVNYRAESENEVSELEIQNIIAHFKKLGRNTEKYVSSFENIASQYTNEQLKIIINCLPLNVKAVLEQTSAKYQEIMSINGEMIRGVRSSSVSAKEDQKRTGLKIDIIENKLNQTKMTKPIVIPNSVKKSASSNVKKVENVSQRQNEQLERAVQAPVKRKVQPTRAPQMSELQKEQILAKRAETKRAVPTEVAQKRPVQRQMVDSDDMLVKKAVRPSRPVAEIPSQPKTVNPSRPAIELPSQPKAVKPVRKGIAPSEIETPQISKKPPVKEEKEELDDFELPDLEMDDDIFANENVQKINTNQVAPSVETEKKKRGRPRKNQPEEIVTEEKPKGKKGRPRKNPVIEEEQEETVDELPDLDTISSAQLDFDLFDMDEEESMPTMETEELEDLDMETADFDGLMDLDEQDDEINEEEMFTEEVSLPDLDDLEDINDFDDDDSFSIEESFDEFDDYDEYGEYQTKSNVHGYDETEEIDDLYREDILEDDDFQIPEIDELEDDENVDLVSSFDEMDDDLENNLISDFDDNDDLLLGVEEEELSIGEEENTLYGLGASDIFDSSDEIPEPETMESNVNYGNEALESIGSTIDYSMSNLNSLITKDKKIVTFVGSPKNGVSFLVNNLAEVFASLGINTAVLDMTQNKNSYYIYTQNVEELRKLAYTSIEKLQRGVAEGIRVKENLTVYTALPNDGKNYSNAEPILSTLIQNHSLVLIDCDFDTHPSYFASCQEIYLVQSMDVLTIQPLTAFLRDLKTQGVLETEKVKVVINKEIKVKDLTNKSIIGGMSYYNDPSMSFMTELFNKDIVKYCSIPFEEMTYSRYLEAMFRCKVSINGYSKNFMNKLRVLADMVYPLTSRQTYGAKGAQGYKQTGFSSSMNNTLNKMKKKY